MRRAATRGGSDLQQPPALGPVLAPLTGFFFRRSNFGRLKPLIRREYFRLRKILNDLRPMQVPSSAAGVPGRPNILRSP